jgi:ElaB/YqjD/DUF883 family membrane-anchored ribosome-binding protein
MRQKDKNMNKPQSFKNEWSAFFKSVFKPIPIFALLTSAALIILSIFYQDKKEFSILINLIGSLLIGIAGAFIKGSYDLLTQDSILIKKGQSAKRNLESIGQQVLQIRKWINCFCVKGKTDKRNLEEIDRHLSTTQMNISAGLEDWIDIIPELQEKKEEIEKYQNILKSYVEELFKNKKKLIEAGTNKELREEVGNKIKELEKEVKELKKYQPGVINNALYNAENSFVHELPFVTLAGIGNKICMKCGKNYKEGLSNKNYSVLSSVYDPEYNYCPDCKK